MQRALKYAAERGCSPAEAVVAVTGSGPSAAPVRYAADPPVRPTRRAERIRSKDEMERVLRYQAERGVSPEEAIEAVCGPESGVQLRPLSVEQIRQRYFSDPYGVRRGPAVRVGR
jgi:hypothetical protein